MKAFSAVAIVAALVVVMLLSHGPGPAPAPSKNDITLQKFYALSDGMSYEDVAKVLGSPGQLVSRNVTPGIEGFTDPVTLVMVEWHNPGVFAGNMNVTFQNDQLIGKAQLGLR